MHQLLSDSSSLDTRREPGSRYEVDIDHVTPFLAAAFLALDLRRKRRDNHWSEAWTKVGNARHQA